jgi:hypothetical protein
MVSIDPLTIKWRRTPPMFLKTHKLIPVAALLTCMAAATEAFAGTPPGGVITYGPPAAQSIPVLSDLMLVVLGLFLAVMAYRVLRTHPGGTPLASLAALAIVGLSTVPGVKFIEGAHAIQAFSMTSPSGGTIEIFTNTEVPVSNGTGVAQQIKGIQPNNNCYTELTVASPTCTEGGIVQPNAACYINFECGNQGPPA